MGSGDLEKVGGLAWRFKPQGASVLKPILPSIKGLDKEQSLTSIEVFFLSVPAAEMPESIVYVLTENDLGYLGGMVHSTNDLLKSGREVPEGYVGFSHDVYPLVFLQKSVFHVILVDFMDALEKMSSVSGERIVALRERLKSEPAPEKIAGVPAALIYK